MMLLRLNEVGGESIVVNMELVTCFKKEEEIGTTLFLVDPTDTVTVKETVDELIDIISRKKVAQ